MEAPAQNKNLLCDNISNDELLFFNQKPQMLPLYEALRDRLAATHKDISIKVTKTQISIKNRYIFALASFGRVPHAPKEYLLVSFGLGYEKPSPRIAVATEATRNRWTHHVVVQREEELDAELLGWIEEAYQFANNK